MFAAEKELLKESPALTAEQIQKALGWISHSNKVSPEIKVSIYSAVWLASVVAFHKQEDEALENGKYKQSLDEHRFVLSNLITEGEKLVLSAKQNGMAPDTPFSLADLQSTVESLHISFHCQHRSGNSTEDNLKIADIFNVKKSGN